MKLKRFLLRYYPPGVILEYELRDKSKETKEIGNILITVRMCMYHHHNHQLFHNYLIKKKIENKYRPITPYS